MDRDGADRVVDAQFVQSDDAEYHQGAADCTKQGCGEWRRSRGLGRDGDQAGQGTVESMVRSALPNIRRAVISAATAPPAAAVLVLRNTIATEWALQIGRASCRESV